MIASTNSGEKIRVLYLEYAIAWGGSGKSLVELIDSQSGVSATVLTRIPFPTGALDSRKVRYEEAILPRWASYLPSYAREVIEDTIWIGSIIRVARACKAEVLHLNNGISYNLASMVAARWLGIPFVVHQRGWEKPRRRLSIARRLLGHFPVLAISDAIAAHLRSTVDESLDIRTVYDVVRHPTHQRTPHKENERVTVGMHGMLTPWKGQLLLVRAAAHIRTQYGLLLQYKIAGAPVPGAESYLTELRTAIEQLGLGEHFELVGLVDDVYEFLSTLDVSVHASLDPEPLGRVIVEAQLAGVPVVASGEAGALELLADSSGVSFKPGDALDLAEKIYGLAIDKQRRSAIASEALKTARGRFDEAMLGRAVQSIYEDMVASDSSRRPDAS